MKPKKSEFTTLLDSGLTQRDPEDNVMDAVSRDCVAMSLSETSAEASLPFNIRYSQILHGIHPWAKQRTQNDLEYKLGITAVSKFGMTV